MTFGKFLSVSTRLIALSMLDAITPAALLKALANRLPMKLPLMALPRLCCVDLPRLLTALSNSEESATTSMTTWPSAAITCPLSSGSRQPPPASWRGA